MGRYHVHVVSWFKQMVVALDFCTTEKHDDNANAIRDQVLSPISVLMLLSPAKLLEPISIFCCLLQYKNLNHSLTISKFTQIVTKLSKIKSDLPNHDVVDVSF